MNRRSFLMAATACALLAPTTARAEEDYVEAIVDWLDKHGYAAITVSRTLLGRVRIVADKGGRQRELVCNPRTGEILRDVWIAADGEVQAPDISPGTSGGGATDDRNDRNDDRHGGHGGDDDGSDDDSSGHGGGDDDEKDDGGDDHGGKRGHGGGDDDKSGRD